MRVSSRWAIYRSSTTFIIGYVADEWLCIVRFGYEDFMGNELLLYLFLEDLFICIYELKVFNRSDRFQEYKTIKGIYTK